MDEDIHELMWTEYIIKKLRDSGIPIKGFKEGGNIRLEGRLSYDSMLVGEKHYGFNFEYRLETGVELKDKSKVILGKYIDFNDGYLSWRNSYSKNIVSHNEYIAFLSGDEKKVEEIGFNESGIVEFDDAPVLPHDVIIDPLYRHLWEGHAKKGEEKVKIADVADIIIRYISIEYLRNYEFPESRMRMEIQRKLPRYGNEAVFEVNLNNGAITFTKEGD